MYNTLVLGRHIYTRIEPVYLKDLECLKGSSYLYDKIWLNNSFSSVSVNDFLNELESYYEHANSHENARVLEKLRVMLPTRCNKSIYKEFFEDIVSTVKNIEDCPIIAKLEKKGKCAYLDIYVCERMYNPEGIESIQYYTSDWYRNKKTGRRCTKNHPDAILEHGKGEFRSSETVKFSKKKNVFRLTRGEFKELKRNLVRKINSFCDKHALSPRMLVLNHLDYDKISKINKILRIHAACFNAYISKIENEITKCYMYMSDVGFDDVKNRINDLCNTFFKRIGDGFSGSYKSSSRSFFWKIDLSDSKCCLLRNLELMFSEFDRQLRNIVTANYLPNY